jgi:hypothetical protein
LGDALAPPNQTRSEHVQTHGSVDERHVPGNDGHMCPRLERGLQWLKYSSYSFNNLCLLTSQRTSKIILFSSRLEINHMMILKGCLFILDLGVDVNTTFLFKFCFVNLCFYKPTQCFGHVAYYDPYYDIQFAVLDLIKQHIL